MRPAGRRALVHYLEESFRVSERKACAVVCVGRSTHRYRSVAQVQTALRVRIREIAAVRVRYGYKRIHVLLRREGWTVNHKRVYRLYCEQGLNLRRKQKRKRAGGNLRLIRQQPLRINECWSMDFAADALFNGRRFRVLSVVDIFSRECLGMEIKVSVGRMWWSCWIESKRFAGPPEASVATTARSLCPKFWTAGLTRTEWR